MSTSRKPKRRLWPPAVVLALVACALVRTGHFSRSDAPPSGGSPVSHPSSPAPSAAPSASGTSAAYDPAVYALAVRTQAGRAGVSARLLMAILCNEAYKPHDPAFERAWQKYKPDAAFGIANMHRATFDQVKQGRDFADRRWSELPDDRTLAIEAAAWYLHDLRTQLPAHRTGSLSEDELLALGYNTGAGNMLAFARGVGPGSQARSYLDKLHANWSKAEEAVAR